MLTKEEYNHLRYLSSRVSEGHDHRDIIEYLRYCSLQEFRYLKPINELQAEYENNFPVLTK